jgi:hypothetical protein
VSGLSGIAVFAALALLACGDSRLTGPSKLVPERESRRSVGSQEFEIPVNPVSDGEGVPLMSTGIMIPKLATYVMRVSGVVTATPNSGNPCSDAVIGLPTLTFGEGFITDELRPTVNGWQPSPTRWVSDTIPPGAEQKVFVSRGGFIAGVGCNAPDGSRIGGPLYNLSSSQTLTVDILKIGTFKLAIIPKLPNPVPRDTTVVFIQSNDGDTQDSFVPDSWNWAPSDGSPAEELFPNFCGIVCRRKLTTSGTMTLSGTVGGFLDGHRERVSATATVTVAGDPKITMTVSSDTVALGDSVTVSTTITDATKDTVLSYSVSSILATRFPSLPTAARSGSVADRSTSARDLGPGARALRTTSAVSLPRCVGATAVTQCVVIATQRGPMTIQVQATADGRALTASKTVEVGPPSPHLEVACTSPKRGDDVSCTARVTTGDPTLDPPFIVEQRVAKGKGFLIPESPNVIVGAGLAHEWKGPAVAKTEVTFTVRFDDRGKSKTESKKKTFDPTTRGWPEFKLLTAGKLTKALGPNMTDDLVNGKFGLFDFEDPKLDPGLATTVPDGPNKDLSYFVTPIAFPDISVSYVHPGLYGGINKIGEAWYNDQNNKGSGTCTAKDVNKLRIMAEIHEGATADRVSHWQVANDAMASAKLQGQFESMYVQDAVGKLAEAAEVKYIGWKAGDYAKRQHDFDNKDRLRIFGSLNCTLDHNLSDN